MVSAGERNKAENGDSECHRHGNITFKESDQRIFSLSMDPKAKTVASSSIELLLGGAWGMLCKDLLSSPFLLIECLSPQFIYNISHLHKNSARYL